MSATEWILRPTTRRDLVTAELDGELVIFDPIASRVHELDRLATVIWPFLDGTATAEELAADLADAFAQPVEVVRADLDDLIASLADRQLLQGFEAQVARPAPDDAAPAYLKDPPSP